MKITCGIDWAEAHHDVAVLDAGGQVGRSPGRAGRPTAPPPAGRRPTASASSSSRSEQRAPPRPSDTDAT